MCGGLAACRAALIKVLLPLGKMPRRPPWRARVPSLRLPALASACEIAAASPPAVPPAAALIHQYAVSRVAATPPALVSACAFAAASPSAACRVACCGPGRGCFPSSSARVSAAAVPPAVSPAAALVRLVLPLEQPPRRPPWRARVPVQRPRCLPCRLLQHDRIKLPLKQPPHLPAFGEHVRICSGRAACCAVCCGTDPSLLPLDHLPYRLLRHLSKLLLSEQPPRRPHWRARVRSQRPRRLPCRPVQHSDHTAAAVPNAAALIRLVLPLEQLPRRPPWRARVPVQRPRRLPCRLMQHDRIKLPLKQPPHAARLRRARAHLQRPCRPLCRLLRH